jgi:hypothetical protein
VRLVADIECRTGKAVYLTYDHAAASIKAFARSDRKQKGYLHPYRCPVCRQWHVGSPSRASQFK